MAHMPRLAVMGGAVAVVAQLARQAWPVVLELPGRGSVVERQELAGLDTQVAAAVVPVRPEKTLPLTTAVMVETAYSPSFLAHQLTTPLAVVAVLEPEPEERAV